MRRLYRGVDASIGDDAICGRVARRFERTGVTRSTDDLISLRSPPKELVLSPAYGASVERTLFWRHLTLCDGVAIVYPRNSHLLDA